MRTQVLFYSFDSKAKPGKIICHGVRFETVELDATNSAFDETTFPLLCPQHIPAEVPIKALKDVVKQNLRG